MHTIFDGVPNCLVYLDDLLIYAPDKETHDRTLREVLSLIRKHGLSLNRKKCSFRLDNIDFLGFRIEGGTIRPSTERIQSLVDFPQPVDLKALQRFLGMATYFSKYVQHFSDLAQPLLRMKNSLQKHSLGNPKIEFWPPEAAASFQAIKKEIVGSLLVLPSAEEELVLRTDASDSCIAAVLQTSTGQPVSFLSRVLTDAEKRYDIVEKEALAVYWGIMRSRMFLLGRHFKVISDHRPAQFLFNCDKVSPKVLRWRLALQEFTFVVVYSPGKANVAADCFSRICFADFAPPPVDVTYIGKTQSFDDECKEMCAAIASNKLRQKPGKVGFALWSQRKSLRVENGMLKNGNGQIFVPRRARIKVLTVCHGLHRGIVATLASLREVCFWPGMRKDAENFVKNCRICCFAKPKFFPPSNEPLMTKAPMEILAMDYIGPLPDSNGFRYILTAIDLFSRYAFAFAVKDLSAATLIAKCKEIFVSPVFSIVFCPITVLSLFVRISVVFFPSSIFAR